MYKYIGTSTYPRRDGNGQLYIIFLAESQPDGQFRPMSYFSNGRSTVGSFVSVEVYNAVMAKNFKFGDTVNPTWGPRDRIEGLDKA